ncbi:chemotaxis protein CheY [Desulfocarbo indianensis]|nr:chemotaxis protein CheY [Desulfocarbo indianensis]
MSARILLVEDSPTILNLLSMVLRQVGFAVQTANDGLEALDKLSKESVDLIITDVNMPRMDGFTFISRVRSQGVMPKVPIIVLSTEREDHDRLRGRSAGADLYLTKPVQPQTLVDHVRSLLTARAEA